MKRLFFCITLTLSGVAHAAPDYTQQGSDLYDAQTALDIKDAVDAGKRISQDDQQMLDKFYRAQQQKILQSQQKAADDYKTAQANYDDRGMEKNSRLLSENTAKSREIEQLRLKAYRASRGKTDNKVAEARNAANQKKQATVDDLFGGLTNSPNTPKSQQVPVKHGTSGLDISQYGGQLKAAIENKLDASKYKDKYCTLRLDMARDGTLNSVKAEGGDPFLCAAALNAVKIARLPKPPSDEVWQIFKNAPLDFKP